MDRHAAPGITLSEALVAHDRDVAVQGKHGCRARTFWLDDARGFINCLIDAPSKEAVVSMHDEAHGQIPSEIIEVHPDLVLAFLGRLDDLPVDAARSSPTDSSFRAILFTDLVGSTAMTARYGDAAAMQFVRDHDAIVRTALAQHRGREIKHTGDGIMASFAMTFDAVTAAIQMQREFARHNREADVPLHVRIGISAGEPLCENNDLFGACVQLAARLCAHAQAGEILVSQTVVETIGRDAPQPTPRDAAMLKGFDMPTPIFSVDAT